MILRKAQRGFTLVEVMIAMAILAGGLVLLLRSTASNIFSANRARMLTAATNLARAQMYDLEELLLEEGFQERDLALEGDFGDQGWPKITWKAEIIRIELPDMSTLAGMAGGEEGEGGEAGGGGMLGGITGQPGTASEAADAGIMGSYYGMISEVLSESIRKVDLTISYPVVNEIESFVVTCYFTDPSAVNRKIPFAGGGGAGGDSGEAGDDSGDTPGTGSGSGRTPTVTPSGGRGGDR